MVTNPWQKKINLQTIHIVKSVLVFSFYWCFVFNSDGSCFVTAQKVFEEKYLHQGCMVTDHLVLTPNMNTLCDRGKVGLICFVAPKKSIFLWRPQPGFNFQMSKGVNLSPLVNPENKHKLQKRETVKTIQNQIEFRLRANRDTPLLTLPWIRMIRVSYY